MSADGRGTEWRRKIAEIYNRLSRVHERYRQTDDRPTDGRATANSECERSLETKATDTCFKRSVMLVNSSEFVKVYKYSSDLRSV